MIVIDINPVAFSIGPFHVSWYGIMVALAVLALVTWSVWQVKRGAKVSYDTIFTIALVGIPSGIVGSKLLHVIDQWSYYLQNPGRILSGEGLTIYGAVLGAALGIWVYSRVSRSFKFGYMGDMLAPGIILAQAIGRVGCTLNGCCYGLETDAFCAVIYSSPYSYGPIGIPVYPTQVFEIVYDLIVFGVLIKLRGHFKPEGSIFLIYLSLYALWRFSIEFLREGTPFLWVFHEAHVVSFLVLLVTIPLLALRTRWVGKEAKPVEPPTAG